MENEDPQAIRDQIEVTRERIADTAEALAYKSDVPARVKEDLADRVETAKVVASDVAATAASSLASAAEAALKGAQELTVAATPHIVDATNAASDVAARVKDEVTARVDAVTPAIADAAAALSAAGTTAAAKLADAGESARATFADTSAAASDGGNVLKTAQTLIAKNPFALALGAIGVGFLLGLLIPVSDAEREQIGPLGERAKDAASGYVEGGKAAVAGAVSDALTPAKPDPPA